MGKSVVGKHGVPLRPSEPTLGVQMPMCSHSSIKCQQEVETTAVSISGDRDKKKSWV